MALSPWKVPSADASYLDAKGFVAHPAAAEGRRD
jgi:hypothetical protein